MIYIAIDNKSAAAKKMVELIEEMPFATVYREFNEVTERAFAEIREGKTVKGKKRVRFA